MIDMNELITIESESYTNWGLNTIKLWDNIPAGTQLDSCIRILELRTKRIAEALDILNLLKDKNDTD